jgi:hypothetical protein
MATTKTFKVAGTSTLNGVTKVRFAQDYVGRFKILNKNGHTNIELIELGEEMSKADICKMLMAHPKFQSEEQQSAIAQFVVKNIKAAPVVDDNQAEEDLAVAEMKEAETA